MKQNGKSSAPALEKGIQALNWLSEVGPQKLETISRELCEPKASLLRYLDTLLSLGLVGRDPVSKEYVAKAAIISFDSAGRELSGKIQKHLDALAERTGRTAEWYVLSNGGMSIMRRSEPEKAEIHVKAKVGFVRSLEDEFEAVARVAALNLNLGLAGKKYWIWMKGKKKSITETACGNILKNERKNGYALDLDYNGNGVRRYAAPVFHNGGFAGIVALAENFKPDADSQIPEISRALKDEINLLEGK